MNPSKNQFDVAIIGGGLHGAAIAADCAGRGLHTLLCDQNDVGGSHNIVSKRLFHCGLQYLQRGDISRVTESVHERSLLAQRAPHLAQPTTVIIPQPPNLTSRVKANTTAFLYKLVAGHQSHLQTTNLADKKIAAPLKPLPKKTSKRPAIQFEDLLVNDSRLTIENLLLARGKGSFVLPQTALTSAKRVDGKWQLELTDELTGYSANVESTCVINAAGPFANKVQKSILNIESRCSANNYLAGYIVVPALFTGEQTYLFEYGRNQLIAAIPYVEKHTLIGPFIYEEDINGANHHLPHEVSSILLELINKHFKTKVSANDILHSFSVFTSSYKETPEAQPTPFSQDYVLDFNCSDGKSPCISLFGACLNMHRQIAEQVIEQMMPYLPNHEGISKSWTAKVPLPGGHFQKSSKESYMLEMADKYPWLPNSLLQRYIDSYGSRCDELLKGCQSMADLGSALAPDFYEKEALWLCDNEWVCNTDALVWHRTKLGLLLSKNDIYHINQWFEEHFRYHSALLELHSHTQLNRQAS